MFRNEPPLDFTVASERERLQRALNQLEQAMQQEKLLACPIVGGKLIGTEDVHLVQDPSEPTVCVGRVQYADVTLALRALEELRKGAPAWERLAFEKRSAIIARAGGLMRERRVELTALIIREAGKPWREADADVVEAIDFCEYYAEEMLRLGAPRRTQEVPGEDNVYFYQPRGIALVIAPWNFPLAIACGMVTAALVTGNATILKPAEQTSLIAFELAKILLEAGVPGDAFAFLPGVGEDIGSALVESPHVDVICFTGSKAVGLHIVKAAAEVRPEQRNVKKVIAEMGGKNAIIVDSDADLDEAIKGVLYSGFGYSGQKCSACSRVIVVGDAYQPFISRLSDAASDICVGPARISSTLLGPVIDQEAQQRILRTIAEAEKENKLAFKGQVPSSGYFVPATIFREVDPQSSLWKEEIFGPVIACLKVDSIEEALQVANDSPYALTGGFFSRSPANIELVRKEFKVGNLYVNRGCTGAIVCRQPFGGFRMSGVGSKAGGPDYLLQFLEPRVVTENMMRRGFSPEVE
jgi:RHH-type proline utilization regulon transcriptional repressor/proline dehydrogenase/delta 1-pyrroline-5-carboxylate dehydrogenase